MAQVVVIYVEVPWVPKCILRMIFSQALKFLRYFMICIMSFTHQSVDFHRGWFTSNWSINWTTHKKLVSCTRFSTIFPNCWKYCVSIRFWHSCPAIFTRWTSSATNCPTAPAPGIIASEGCSAAFAAAEPMAAAPMAEGRSGGCQHGWQGVSWYQDEPRCTKNWDC